MICKLCGTREANNKGSHIIPDFILRTMLVDGDTNKRSDKIISNRIDALGTDLFLGRDINQDKVNELLGRDITDEEANNLNHYTVDFVFCSKCEDRFSYLETLFKTEIYDTLKTVDSTDITIEFRNKDIQIFKLFWLSIIWRCSIVKFQTFSLDSKLNKNIQNLLHNCLGYSVSETKTLIANNKSKIDSEVVGVLFIQKVKCYLKNLVFCNPYLKMPYTLVINDFYIFYYSKPSHINTIKQSIYKLDNIFKPEDYINTKDCKTVKIGLIPTEKFKESRDYIYSLKASVFLDKIVRLFSDTFTLVYGIPPTRIIISEFINDLIHKDDVNVHERYKMNRIMIKIRDNVIKYVG